jgi:V8-like Glu-specific endopeptidase
VTTTRSRRAIATAIAALAAAASLVLAPAAQAAPTESGIQPLGTNAGIQPLGTNVGIQPLVDGGDDVARATVPQAAQQRAETYWTPERLRSAKPGDLLLAGRDLAEATGDVARGVEKVVRGTVASTSKGLLGLDLLADGGGALYDGGGAVVRTTGKVFFTLGGTNYQCSGSSVVSGSDSLVQTAGHCLNEGPGAFATNFVFIPQYRDGAAPFGQFTATELFTTEQWRTAGDLDYDVGYAKVGTANGSTLADAVGAQGIGFNLERGAEMYAFGYPAAAPYDGSKLAWCFGTVAADPLGSADQGLTCDMTGGSSGGPWFIDYDAASGIGTLNSLNSFKYNLALLNGRMYGPYFGSVIEDLYTTAAAA